MRFQYRLFKLPPFEGTVYSTQIICLEESSDVLHCQMPALCRTCPIQVLIMALNDLARIECFVVQEFNTFYECNSLYVCSFSYTAVVFDLFVS